MTEAASIPPMTAVPRTRRETAPEPDAGSGERGFFDALAVFVFVLGELDDQDGVFGGQPDQHDQADLSVHVILKVAQHQEKVGAEDRDRSSEQHAERKRPAFILGGEDEEYEQKR